MNRKRRRHRARERARLERRSAERVAAALAPEPAVSAWRWNILDGLVPPAKNTAATIDAFLPPTEGLWP